LTGERKKNNIPREEESKDENSRQLLRGMNHGPPALGRIERGLRLGGKKKNYQESSKKLSHGGEKENG